MPVVEESGLIVPLGKTVLEEACRQAQRWQEDTSTPPMVQGYYFAKPMTADAVSDFLAG